MLLGFNLEVLFPGLILLIATVDDLRTRKIHNKLIIILLPFVLALVVMLKGFHGLLEAFVSALFAFTVATPLTLARVIGGGDLKLLVLLGLTMHWSSLFTVFIYSLPWALLLGFFKIALDKRLKEFFFNLFFLLKYRKTEGLKFHSIPFSLALFMGWLSFVSLQKITLF